MRERSDEDKELLGCRFDRIMVALLLILLMVSKMSCVAVNSSDTEFGRRYAQLVVLLRFEYSEDLTYWPPFPAKHDGLIPPSTGVLRNRESRAGLDGRTGQRGIVRSMVERWGPAAQPPDHPHQLPRFTQ